MAELVPVEYNPFEDERLEAVEGNPFGDRNAANDFLDKGFQFTPEENEAVTGILSPQDMEMKTYTQWLNLSTGTNHTPEMARANLEYEYGKDATPQVANQMNKKALKWYKDIPAYTGKLTAGAAAQMPKLRGEMSQLYDKFTEDMADKFGVIAEIKKRQFEMIPGVKGFLLANKTWDLVPTEKLQEWGAEQVKEATEIQSEYMSGVPLEKSLAEGDFETAGKDIGTAIAFESPRMALQIAIGLVSPEASLEMMGVTAIGAKRAEKTEEDSLEERVLAPVAVGAIEVATEKLLGTGRIIDAIASKEVKKGIANRLRQIVTDVTGGAISESGATFGENVVDRISGEDVDLKEGVLLSGIVGAVMDVGAGQIMSPMTLGDANRMRKQMSNEEIDSAVESGEFTPEMGDAIKTPTEQNVEAANQSVFEPELDGAPALDIEGGEIGRQERIQQAREDIGAQEEAMEPFIGQDITQEEKNLRQYRSRFKSSLLTPVLSYVKDISPEVYQRLNRFEFDTHQRKRNYQLESEDFLREATELAKNDPEAFTDLDMALMNEDFAKASKYISKDSVDKVRAMLETAADEMEATGLEINRKDGYFPRRVKDYEGLKNELGSEIKGEIEMALNEQERKANDKGYTLSEEERSKIVNQVISGSYRPVGGRKPRALKQRKIDEVTQDIAPYYYDSAESLLMWISDASDVIETRKFFGKDLVADDVVDVNESIGKVIEEITERDNLSPEDQNKLIGALRARFGYRPTGKLASKYKSLVAMTTLGQVQNAVTQFGDAAWSFYESGVGSTLKATVSEKQVKMEDLGIEEVAEEFRTPDGMNGVVNRLFKFTGLKRIDRLGKESLINAAFDKYQQEAQTGEFSLDRQERLDVLFGGDQESVINDLKNGERTDDVNYLLFSTLLDWQPITLSNMPIQYLKNPNGRVMYTLKTFTIKQLDNFRTRAIDNITEGIETGDTALATTGMKNLLRLAGLFYLANIPIDLIKDWMSGKDIEMTDIMIDNIYKLIGLSRYSVEYATKGGRKPSNVIPDVIVPPLNFIDYPATDIQNIADKLSEGEEIDLMNLESWKMLPIAGRTLYWTAGRGEEKEEKKRDKE